MDESVLQNHRLTMNNRQSMDLTGVKEVRAFDEHRISLDTCKGRMEIQGEQLHIHHLTLEMGEVGIEGKITSLSYSEKGLPAKKGSRILERMFR